MAGNEGDTRVMWVSQVTRYIKQALDSDPVLSNVWVRGEMSNFKHHHSGHMYFTLKDEHSSMRCVMFRARNARLTFTPGNGCRVVAKGSVTVYERDGQYQLYVDRMTEDGLGALHQAFLVLKHKLEAEGLFEPTRKRRLPSVPGKVAVITSLTGAAVRDIVSIARRRFDNCHLVLVPVLVQGMEAPGQIARAIGVVNDHELADVIIVGRGGGSLEELWAFNDETVARAIFASRIPVVSAVGHESDVTIGDLVADVRAPTPSAAAELVLPVKADLVDRISSLIGRAGHCLVGRLGKARQRLDRACMSGALARPLDRINQLHQLIDELGKDNDLFIAAVLRDRSASVKLASGRLHALSPHAVISRGYSVVQRHDGVVVTRAAQVEPGDRVDIVVTDGRIGCAVTDIKQLEGDGGAGDHDFAKR